MDGQEKTPVQLAREAQFSAALAAFQRRDFETVEASWRPDIVMEMPGTSWLAGTHEGFEDVSRCVTGLRHVLDSEDLRTVFLHEGGQMLVQHDIAVHGPEHAVEMRLRVKIRYDSEGKAE
jgi:ketosteroid isomerase-like protein